MDVLETTVQLGKASLELENPQVTAKRALRDGASLISNRDSRIIDIRRGFSGISLVDDIRKGLQADNGAKTLPTLLLYDEQGLKLFEEITYLEEYYLTNEEIGVLEEHADTIADAIPSGAVLCEMGSGNLRKVNILLSALERQAKAVEYYALDVNLEELERTLAQVPEYKHVQCFGLLGTYDDGFEWLRTPQVSNRFKMIMSLGSSIGNFSRQDAATFVKDLAEAAGKDGAVLLGIDGCLQADRVYKAYNDSRFITRAFTLNGLKHANKLLGQTEFPLDIWNAVGRYDESRQRHQAFVTPNRDTSVLGVTIRAGEMVRIEESLKYAECHVSRLLEKARVKELYRLTNKLGDYAMHLVNSNKYALPLDPQQYAAQPVPTLAEWKELWQLWDTVSGHMIPNEELLEKPIKLRNACIFYLGHIPTFCDMKITETTKEAPTKPGYFHQIFARGIDPDVDNPEQCHAHSEVPNEWPPLAEILAYQKRVRARVQRFYDCGADTKPKVSRTLWLVYEHEAMHLETLLYMLIQSEKTRTPTGVPMPEWTAQAEQAKCSAVPNKWIKIPAQKITINMDDPETDAGPHRYFGWDSEKPSRKLQVHAFQARARPITNGEYAEYLQNVDAKKIPASWAEGAVQTEGLKGHFKRKRDGGHNSSSSATPPSAPESYLNNKYVRTVFGRVPLANALAWPVSASYDELAGCAAYMGGRIPTFEEARSIYAYAEDSRNSKKAVEQRLGRTIPAVNSHLVNEGVPESPPANGSVKSSTGSKISPHELFANLQGCNVGFQNWHPMPVTQNGDQLSGQAEMGGLWEWTSSPLQKQPGFEPMPLYPDFSADFHDGKHNIVLGGSWATVSRLAGRRSFINWYQRNYPYVWAGARLVKDV